MTGEIDHPRECEACGATTFAWERCHECGDRPWKNPGDSSTRDSSPRLTRTDRAIDALGAVADHRYTILAAWLAPAATVLLAPPDLEETLLLALMGVVLVMHQAQLARRDPL